MKRAMVFCLAAAFYGLAFAWGPGHDTVARCVLEKLPSEWRARFKSEWMKPYLAASHLPDNGSLKLLRPEDVEWFKTNCGLKDAAYPFHFAPCFLGEVSRLVHAIRAGDDYSVFMYLASISHSLADPAACNHDPIIHVLTYTWGIEGLNLLPETGRPLPVDFAFVEHDADTRAVLARRLAALKVPDVPQDITAEALFAQILRWDCLAMEPCCATSQRIVENGSLWMTTGDKEAKCAAADALCDLGFWSVERTLYVFAAACRLAAQGEIDFTPERLVRFKEEAKTNEVEIIARTMESDSFARPYFAEKGRPMRFAALYDPTAHMASSVFCAGGRQLACQVVGTLKKVRPDLNAGLFDVRTFARDGLDPAATPYVMVFQRVAPWRGFDVKRFNAKLAEYKKAGGMVIWVEGRPPEHVFGKDVVKAMSDGGLRDGYCKPAFPVPLEEIKSCSLAWVGQGGEKSWPYRRTPTGKAGWTWHGSPWRFDLAKLPKEARSILELRAPGRTFVTGVAVPGAVYLPYNALFPYCLTDEKPSFSPFRLSLDSAGEAILGRVLAGCGGVRRVLVPLKPGEIVARGWLRRQLELSLSGMGGHLGEIEPDQMEKPYVTRDYNPANGARGKVGWCAEMGGEYALGSAMLAYTLDDPALIAKAAERVRAAMALQEPDGYLGAYRPGDDRQEDYNAWGCHWFYNTMLLEYARTGDKAILEAIHRGLLWFVKNWSGEKKTEYAGPKIIEPASFVYILTGDRRLLDFCEEYAAWLDRPGHKKGVTFTKFPLLKGAFHAAAYATRAKLPAALALASGRRELLVAALKAYTDFREGAGWQATYAPCGDGEMIADPSCVGETEYCNFLFYQDLFSTFASLTGETRWADAIERIVFNAAQGARAKDERTIGYMSSPNQWYATPTSSRWGPEPFYHAYAPNMNAACCPANSIRLYPEYVMYAVSHEGKDLRVMNYGPYEVRTKVDGKDVRLVSETDYPFDGKVSLRVCAEGWGGALRLRRPAWAKGMTVARAGKSVPVKEANGVATIEGPWTDGETVVVDFDWHPLVRTVQDRDFKDHPLKTVEWGALVFSQPVGEKWTKVERSKPSWGDDEAPPQPAEWPWFSVECVKEPEPYALPSDLSPSEIRVLRCGKAELPWRNPPVKLIVPMVRSSAAYPLKNRRDPSSGSKYKGTHTPLPSAGLVEPDAGATRENVEFTPFGATCLRTTCFPTAR